MWEADCLDEDGSLTDECRGWEMADTSEGYVRVPATFGELTTGGINTGLPLMLLAVGVLAASLVGSEFSSGNLGTQLLFTPRRIPVMMAKVVAATVGGVLLAVAHLVTSLAFSAIMFLSLRGAADMTAGVELPLMLGRALVLAVLIAIMGAAMAMAAGSTMVSLGIFAVVLVGSAMTATGVPGNSIAQLLLPSNLLQAMILGRHEVYGYAQVAGYEDWQLMQVINYDWALGYSVIGTALIVVVSAWLFRRRDILR